MTRVAVLGNEAAENRNGRYIDCRDDWRCKEIVERESLDSAADLAASARDPENQGIYMVKKPANVFDLASDDADALKQTFNEVLDILGVMSGSKCDPKRCNVKKVLMLTDGDIDGDQIAFSMICLLAKHCRPLMDAGMIGRVLPPAYAIPTGKKGKYEYAHTQREFFNMVISRFVKDVTISRGKKDLSKKELYRLLSDNFNYDIEINKLSKRYCCFPNLMEEIIWNYHGSWDEQKKSYWMKALSKYRDLRVLTEKEWLSSMEPSLVMTISTWLWTSTLIIISAWPKRSSLRTLPSPDSRLMEKTIRVCMTFLMLCGTIFPRVSNGSKDSVNWKWMRCGNSAWIRRPERSSSSSLMTLMRI